MASDWILRTMPRGRKTRPKGREGGREGGRVGDEGEFKACCEFEKGKFYDPAYLRSQPQRAFKVKLSAFRDKLP